MAHGTEKLQHVGSAKKRVASVPQTEQLVRTSEPPWRERGESERQHGVKMVASTVKKGEFQGRERGQAKRVPLKAVE